jgi:hypothetical protein
MRYVIKVKPGEIKAENQDMMDEEKEEEEEE